MKKNLLCLVLMCFILLAGQEDVFAQNNSLIYQQKTLLRIDPQGDEILLQLFLDTCETGVKKVTQQKNIPPQSSQLRAPRFEQENPILPEMLPREVDNTHVVPLFDASTLGNRFMAIMKDAKGQGYQVSLGEPHSWAEPRFFLSKIIVALATASSARFMYVGQEIPLIEWIKKQPDNSVTLENLFRKSYMLNKGDVYLTLLTIENVLSDATFEKRREDTVVNRKLTDLYANSPNKFGDWYHFWGTMLAGYVQEPAGAIAELYSVYRNISRGSEAEKATMAADKAGAAVGTGLRNSVEKEVDGWWRVLLRKMRVSAVTK